MSPTAPGAALLLAHVRDRGVLTAARALRAAGWRVDAGSPRADGGLLGASRAVGTVHVVPRPTEDKDGFVAAVERAHHLGRYDVVFGSGDDWMAATSYLHDRLPLRVAHPSPDVVARALDKLELGRLAVQAGLAAPWTAPAAAVSLDDIALPVVVKNRWHWVPDRRRRHRVETRICQTREGLRQHLEGFSHDGDEPVLQQHIEGGLGALIGVMHQGRLLGRVQQVSSRLWPTPTGASARARTVPVDPDLAARSEDFLRRLGWTGLVELQFLIDEDGVHHLIDVNGRFFGSLALSESARPGLVDAWAHSVIGAPVAELGDGQAGLRYHWLPGDLRRAMSERRGGLATDVWDSVRWGVGARHSVAQLNDLRPVLHLLAGRWADGGDSPVPATQPRGDSPAPATQPRRRTLEMTSSATRRSGARSATRVSW
jgi:predicted ATP-grasp superfamily ATP-dependent carboligase